MGRSVIDDRYLIFTLCVNETSPGKGSEEYAIGVNWIKEIIRYREVSEVPNTSSLVKGVISLRGLVIPVLNLKRYLGLPDSNNSPRTRIMIVRHGKSLAGLPVDSVREVLHFSLNEIGRVPRYLEGFPAGLFDGVIERNDRFIMVINADVLIGQFKDGN